GAAETYHGFRSAWVAAHRARGTRSAAAVRARGRASGGGGGRSAWALARERAGQRGDAQLSAAHARAALGDRGYGVWPLPSSAMVDRRVALGLSARVGVRPVGVEPTSAHGFAGKPATTLCEGVSGETGPGWNSRAGAGTRCGAAGKALPGRAAPRICSRRGLGAGCRRPASSAASGCSRRDAGDRKSVV